MKYSINSNVYYQFKKTRTLDEQNHIFFKKYKSKMKYLVHKMPEKKNVAQESLQNSDLTINVWIKRMCFPNTGRLGGKSKVSDLIGWLSLKKKNNLKTKVKTGKTFSPFFLVLGAFLLEIPGVHYDQKTRLPRSRQFFANSIEEINCQDAPGK